MKSTLIKSNERYTEDRNSIVIHTCIDCYYPEIHLGPFSDYSFTLQEFTIKPNMGFMPHHHQNKDFILIPIQGQLNQNNIQGKNSIIKNNSIHFLSSGKGITHYEYNRSTTVDLVCLVLELTPQVLDTTPYCETVKKNTKQNKLMRLAPSKKRNCHKNIFKGVDTHFGVFHAESKIQYNFRNENSASIVYIISGRAIIDGTELNPKDTLVVWDSSTFNLHSFPNTEIIIFEVSKIRF